jgi:hypothetical protein
VQAEDGDAVKEIKNNEIANKEKNISSEVKKNPLKLVK